VASFDANWDRWIAASINKHFSTEAATYSLEMFVEGEERRTNDDRSYIELRHDGVWWREVSKDWWKGKIDINVLCVAVMESDLYKINRMVGQVTAILAQCIPVYKYGPDAGDDDTQFGELQLLTSEGRDGHRIHKYGQIEPDVKLIQASVECSYRIWL